MSLVLFMLLSSLLTNVFFACVLLFFAELGKIWKPIAIVSHEDRSVVGATLQHFFPEPTWAWRQREEGLAQGSSQQPEFVGPAQCGHDSQGRSWCGDVV